MRGVCSEWKIAFEASVPSIRICRDSRITYMADPSISIPYNAKIFTLGTLGDRRIRYYSQDSRTASLNGAELLYERYPRLRR